MKQSNFDFRKYPHTPGSQRTDTSRQAARATKQHAKTVRDQCCEVLRRYGPLTADEVAEKLGLNVLTVRPRFSELREPPARIVDTLKRRKNASGRPAIVWRAI